MLESLRFIMELCIIEFIIIFISAFITGFMIPEWYDRTRPLPDWVIDEASLKYGRPTFLILNIIFGICYIMEVYHV